MAGTTRGPDSMGGQIAQSIGAVRLGEVERWADARGQSRAASIRALIDVGLDTCPTRYLDRPRAAELAHRRAALIRELAEIDMQLGGTRSVTLATLGLYAFHRADLRLIEKGTAGPAAV